MSETPAPKKPRTRSPAYPAIDLEDAVQKTAVLFDKLDRHWAAPETVVMFWGYDSESSSGHSALSALIKYGLLEDRGSGDKREVRLTDAGKGLVFQADPGTPEHREALQRAALLPTIHAELWKKYDGRFPDDPVIERYLVLERGFNTAYVKGFIKQFKKTLMHAGLIGVDTSSDRAGNPVLQAPALEFVPPTAAKAATAPVYTLPKLFPEEAPRAAQATLIEIPVPLPSGIMAFYRVPPIMTEHDFAFYRALLEAYKPGLVRSRGGESPPGFEP